MLFWQLSLWTQVSVVCNQEHRKTELLDSWANRIMFHVWKCITHWPGRGELGMHSEEDKFFTASSGWGLWEHHARLASRWLGVGPRPRLHLRQAMTCHSSSQPLPFLLKEIVLGLLSTHALPQTVPSHQNGTMVRDGSMIRLACLFCFAFYFWTPLIFLLIKFILLIIS